MRFPGHRIAKHYFPVTKKHTRVVTPASDPTDRWVLVGLDQIMADIEVHGAERLAADFGLEPGESRLLSDEDHRRLLTRLAAEGVKHTISAGGAVGNTVNNYTYLSGEPAILLGAIDAAIRPGSPAFRYVSQTPVAVDLSHLVAREGPIATAITFLGPDGERSFAVAPGVSSDCPPEVMDAGVIGSASAVLTTLYCLRDPSWPIAAAARRMMALAKEIRAPVAFGLGTANLVRERRDEVQRLLQDFVTVAAMNVAEAEALTDLDDALLACQAALDWVDIVIVTEGPRGLTMGGWVDEAYRRETDQPVRSKAIAEYNRWEYSRLMRRSDCANPQKVYTHIHPYRGGPDRMLNTNGAGDAALAAVLHDISANRYHRATVPESDKHAAPVEFLTYSSLSRNAQYGNRVAYEVLKGRSPRLDGPVGSDEEGQG